MKLSLIFYNVINLHLNQYAHAQIVTSRKHVSDYNAEQEVQGLDRQSNSKDMCFEI